jgi:hypothetical protein
MLKDSRRLQKGSDVKILSEARVIKVRVLRRRRPVASASSNNEHGKLR